RPSLQGLELHLLRIINLITNLKPKSVILDPISSLVSIGTPNEVRSMLIRLLDLLKSNQINALFTSLTHNETSDLGRAAGEISSLSDTWINLSNYEHNNERIRNLLIIKSRGMGHVNQEQNFTISNKGIELKLSEYPSTII
ncbi:MAG TPA: ATPase domain-containing protein, partial [Lentimicrobium sp.]|nr:ATPase domain-containing protein [Lentimicrobium sp.]